jgi:hypothetical protein
MSDTRHTTDTPTVVLVNGAFADGSSWEMAGSHVIMVSQPDAVADVILEAVASVAAPVGAAR